MRGRKEQEELQGSQRQEGADGKMLALEKEEGAPSQDRQGTQLSKLDKVKRSALSRVRGAQLCQHCDFSPWETDLGLLTSKLGE